MARLFCVGEKEFCDFFSLMGAEKFIFSDAGKAADAMMSLPADNIVLLSDSLVNQKNPELKKIMDDHGRIIVNLPSLLCDTGESEVKSMMRKLVGGEA